jgi:quercetin dioxygenase-like cupin family protein
MATVQPVDLHFADGNERTCVWETDDLQIMRIRLAPGEALPTHNANSNVVLLPVAGALRLQTPETDDTFAVGHAMSLPGGTPMDVSNAGDEPALLLVLKTPHPKRFAG